tara:strand:- start:756 stop:1199 length:444 start_codon:yes stop_codon:yes gene_type:complete
MDAEDENSRKEAESDKAPNVRQAHFGKKIAKHKTRHQRTGFAEKSANSAVQRYTGRDGQRELVSRNNRSGRRKTFVRFASRWPKRSREGGKTLACPGVPRDRDAGLRAKKIARSEDRANNRYGARLDIEVLAGGIKEIGDSHPGYKS